MSGGEEFEIKTESIDIKTEPIDIKEEWQIDLNQPNIKIDNENEINDETMSYFAPEDFVKCELQEEFIDTQDNVVEDPLELRMKYDCDVCNKSYPRKNSLARHIKSVHEGKKYECKTCNRMFTQSGYLKTHQTAVHEGKKYICKTK